MTSNSPHLLQLGKVTIFFVPSHKLDDARFFHGAHTARHLIHEFLVRRYRAYTHTPTPVKGFWIDPNGVLAHDVMDRFEVSFGSEDELNCLSEFLVELCEQLEEEAIYMTRGERSFLITRHPLKD